MGHVLTPRYTAPRAQRERRRERGAGTRELGRSISAGQAVLIRWLGWSTNEGGRIGRYELRESVETAFSKRGAPRSEDVEQAGRRGTRHGEALSEPSA